MDSIPWVNKINQYPLCIWMWRSSKDTFSVFYQWFHKCIRILEEQWGVRVLLSLQTLHNVMGQCTCMCQLPLSLWTLPIWSCLLFFLQMHSWKGLVIPSCLMQHSPYITRRQTQEIDKKLNLYSERAKWSLLLQRVPLGTVFNRPRKSQYKQKVFTNCKVVSNGLWWYCNGTLGKTRKCYKPAYECA